MTTGSSHADNERVWRCLNLRCPRFFEQFTTQQMVQHNELYHLALKEVRDGRR